MSQSSLVPQNIATQLNHIGIDQIAVPVWWISADGVVQRVNLAACRDVGYSPDAIIGKTIFELNPQVTPKGWVEHWHRLRDRGSITFETSHLHQSGVLYPVEVTVNHVEIDGVELNCAFVINISDRKQVDRHCVTKQRFWRKR
ncbi:MAG: PAS domain S-box protein [Alkalinema sp. RL_2_19]|nr:PAS domain S-box protein [Alkalinema sp. RL_2_19]